MDSLVLPTSNAWSNWKNTGTYSSCYKSRKRKPLSDGDSLALPSGNPGIDRKWEVLEKWLEEAVVGGVLVHRRIAAKL